MLPAALLRSSPVACSTEHSAGVALCAAFHDSTQQIWILRYWDIAIIDKYPNTSQYHLTTHHSPLTLHESFQILFFFTLTYRPECYH